MIQKALGVLKVLVVEDDPNIRRILRDLLRMEGHNVSAVADGESGLKYLQSEEFHLIVTDLGLPGISGWDLARAAKRYQVDIPILAVSSWQGKEAETRMKEYGVDQVIWKPFRFDEIRAAIANLLEKKAG